ncbi:MAG: DUF5011 domain-containing protein, partial [Gammaproteobacteria bacterium]|nr:DUF5011 domain-containing protein [Gammaproteobacteria bacterium]
MLINNRIQSLLLTVTVLLLQACGGGGSSAPKTQPTTDTLAPVITVTGESTVNHEQGTTYSDQGATATDNIDSTVVVTVSGTVGSDAGTYTLTYTAADNAGNSATASRTVIV